ncbi:MAG TPA: hypothetical protein VF597_04355, partial [Candidatus Saccharimonadales bacterium]
MTDQQVTHTDIIDIQRSGGEVLRGSIDRQALVDQLTRDVLTHASDIGIAARHHRVSASDRAERILVHYAELGEAIDALILETEAAVDIDTSATDRAIGATAL